MKTSRLCVMGLVLALLCPAVTVASQRSANIRWTAGRTAYTAGNYDEAIAIWNEPEVVQRNLADPLYFMWLGMAYVNTGAAEKAIETARTGLGLPCTDTQAVSNMHWTIAKAYMLRKNYDPAIAEAQAAIAAAPQDPTNYVLLSRVQVEAKHYDDAAAAAARSIEIKPSADAYTLLGFAQVKLGKLEAAIRNFKLGLSLAPNNTDLWTGLAVAQLMQTDFAGAEATGRDAAAAGVAEGADIQATAAYYAGRVDDALALIDARLAAKPVGGIGVEIKMEEHSLPVIANVVAGSAAANAGIRAGDFVWAVDGEKTHKGVMHITPLMTIDEIAKRLRGAPGTRVEVKLFRPGRLTPTSYELTRTLLTAKMSAVDCAIRSLILRAKGDVEKALASGREAIALNANAFLPTLALGYALLDANQPAEALRVLENPSIEMTPVPFAEAHRQVARALCHAKLGALDKGAEIYFAAADQFDARAVPVWKDRALFLALLAPMAKEHVDKARQLDAQGRYAECLPEYAQALRYAVDEREASALRTALFTAAGRMPTPPELPDAARRRVVRGELLVKEGDMERALVEFSEALRLAPYVPKLYYNTALIYGQLKRYAPAITHMNLYVTAAPEAPDVRAAQDEIIKWELQQERQAKP